MIAIKRKVENLGPTAATIWHATVFLLIVTVSPLGGNQETPVGPAWWPSEWGKDDQRGALNRITSSKVLEAISLIKEGKIYQLGRVYEPGMPLFGDRHYSLTIPGVPSGMVEAENQIIWNDEIFSGEIGQVGTQFDGLGHIGVRVNGEDRFYNGFKLEDFGDSYGLKKLGVENVGVFLTRGVLLDVAAYKGVDRLEVGYVITVKDIKGTLKMQDILIKEGDVVLFRTGHGNLWMIDNEAYNSGVPGPGLQAAKWLIKKKIVMVGGDSWAVEAVPGEDENRPFEVHQWLIAKNGIHIIENLNLDELSRNSIYEFAFFFAPVPLKGATGSPGNPIAVR